MQNNIWIFIQNNAPGIATLFFFLFFCSAVYSVFKKGQDKKFDDYAKIPLNDKEKAKKQYEDNVAAKALLAAKEAKQKEIREREKRAKERREAKEKN